MKTDFNKFDAIVFDMDGVFVDTEIILAHVFHTIFKPLNIKFTDEYVFGFIGHKTSDNLKQIAHDFDIDLDVPKYLAMIEDQYYDKLDEMELSAKEGVWDVWHRAKSLGKKTGLCTTSYKSDVEKIFSKLLVHRTESLEQVFDAIISGDMVDKKKPHPEPYLTICEKLNVQPEKTLVFEDSVSGVNAAKSAGCFCIGVRTPYTKNMDLSLADFEIESLIKIL